MPNIWDVFTVNVDTAAAQEQILNDSRRVRKAWFHARAGNAGPTYWGADDVETTDGMEMLPGEWSPPTGPIEFDPPVKTSEIYVNTATDNDDVDVFLLFELD